MKKQIFSLVLLLSISLLKAQTTNWNNIYGGTDSDKMSAVTETGTNLYWAGYYKSADGDFTSNYGNYDCFILSTDTNGTVQWKKTFGGSLVDYLYDITTDSNGDIIAVGTSKSNDNDITGNQGNYDYLVVKLNSSGIIQWQKSFGGTNIDKATSVLATSDGGYLVLGYSKSTDGDITADTNHGAYDVWLLKLDSAGTILWQKTYGGASDDKAGHIYTNGTNYYIAAYSKSNNGDLTVNHGNYDYWIFSIDNTGTILWQRSYGGSSIDKEPVLAFNTSDLLIAGTSNSNDGDISNPQGGFDFWVLNVNSTNGNIIWQNNYGGTGADFATGVGSLPVLTRSNNLTGSELYAVGYSNSDDGDFTTNQGNYDAWFIGIDFSGNLVNSTNFGGSDIDQFTGAKFNNYTFELNIFGTTKSTDGDITGQHGNYDAWYASFTPELTGAISEMNLIDVKVYPNPANDNLQVQADDMQELLIFDMQGKLIAKYQIQEASNHFTIDISGLSSGNYMLKTISKNGLGLSKIIVK